MVFWANVEIISTFLYSVWTTLKDDLAVFESTLNETLKSNFPLASSEIIKTHAIEFKIPDNNLKEMLLKCSLKESPGTASPNWTLTYGHHPFSNPILAHMMTLMVIEWKDQLEAF